MAPTPDLPSEITEGASLQGNEWGWPVSSFPNAITRAAALGYACLGGQFQFRLSDGSTCEMYWLSASSDDRRSDEAWADYSRRSCVEVSQNFQQLVSETDFSTEALTWNTQIDPSRDLVFVAYFVQEDEYQSLRKPHEVGT